MGRIWAIQLAQCQEPAVHQGIELQSSTAFKRFELERHLIGTDCVKHPKMLVKANESSNFGCRKSLARGLKPPVEYPQAELDLRLRYDKRR